ncbi:hypothetical protein LAUMK41_04869 [Mycobacterium attenuatum]|nr:hypothetical protein LAUMK41_04869 [Mycobacterium attenuatum]
MGVRYGLTLGVESAGRAGMNCAITRWWPGADEQTGLLTLIGKSLSAGQPDGDLDIVVSRQPQIQPQREHGFPHTEVPIE